MKSLLLLSISVAMLALSANQAAAKILRVGYNGVALTGVDYTDFNTCQTAASVGDTIQVYGTQSGTLSKRVVLQGFGYLFDKHPQLFPAPTRVPSQLNITFAAGSDSSVAEGMVISSTIYSSKVIFRRCWLSTMYLYNASTSVNDIKVFSSVVAGGIYMYFNNAVPCKNFLLYNCVISNYIYFYNPGSSGSIINCVTPDVNVWGGNTLQLNDAGFLVKNNILGYYNASTPNTVYESNLFNNAQPSTLPLGSNNKWGLAWSDIFQRLGGTDNNLSNANNIAFDEGYFQLKAGSPAINAGTNASNAATNCGIYGGEPAYVYRLGGIPAIPSVYKLTAPSLSTSTNPYNVTVSVRSNN